jgi:hypothetical protein
MASRDRWPAVPDGLERLSKGHTGQGFGGKWHYVAVPSTISDLFGSVGLRSSGPVRWGEPPTLEAPGVYVVALTRLPDDLDSAMADAPISIERADSLLRVRPELLVDSSRPSKEELAERLRALWLPDEVVLYIGQTSQAIRKRVTQYYKTALGARSPHAGGWPIKLLAQPPHLFVHYAGTDDYLDAEKVMLAQFISSVSEEAKVRLRDPDNPIPYANLEGGGRRKAHGIQGARAPS